MLTLRQLTQYDIPAVAEMCDWSVEDIWAVLSDHMCGATVVECAGRVVAHLFYRISPPYTKVLSFGVHPLWRRNKIGTFLFSRLAWSFYNVRVEVPEFCLDAQLFLRALGYTAVDILRNPDGAEDRYLFVRVS